MPVSCQPMVDTPDSNEEQAARIRAAMDSSGRSQRQIALEVGVSAQAATKWRAMGHMDKSNIPAFCRACGISIEWFLTGEGQMIAGNPLAAATGEQIIEAIRDHMSAAEQTEILRDLALLVSQGPAGSK